MRLRERWSLCAAAIALLLASCAAPGPSPYGPLTARFGYDAKQLDDGAWRVEFTANQLTPRETVENYALYRAAQIAQEQGFERFAVMDKVYDRHTDRTYAYNLQPPGIERHEDRFLGGSAYTDPFASTRLVTTEYRTAVLIVRPFRGTPPEGAIRTYDVRETLARIGPEIKRR